VVKIERNQWKSLYQSVKKSFSKVTRPAEALRVCLWALSLRNGVMVEGQLEDRILGGDWMDKDWWEGVSLDMLEKLGEQSTVLQLGEQVCSLKRTLEEPDSVQRYVTNWFAGWPQVAREACRQQGYEMIAVDCDGERMGQNQLNVQMDMLQISPTLWKMEVARRMDIKVSQMQMDIAGPPCTTQARGDSANKTRKGKKIYANYRVTGGKSRGQPQHPQGTVKGDLARASDRLNVSLVTMLMTTGWTRAFMMENPRGKLREQQYMNKMIHYMRDLDYCRLWTESERQQGYEWQKPSQVWTWRLLDETWKPEGLVCNRSCLCGDWEMVNGTRTWVHRGNLQDLTGMVSRTGRSRESLKCTYPVELVSRWLKWADQ
jgi:hypothetical protein